MAQAIDSGRVESKNDKCDDVTIGLATFFIILIWILFVGLCLKKVVTFLTKKVEEENDMDHQEVSDHLFP